MRCAIALACWTGVALAIPLAGCTESPAKPRTRTNEQGCTMMRNDGPQDPFKTPTPLKEACLGPYLLQVPANYFDNQMGPEFDGSFGLYLEYPSLEPFAPGERMHLSLDVATRTVSIGYNFLDRVDVREFLRGEYTPQSWDHDNPQARLEERIEGEPVYGLTPYYADLPKFFAYHRAKGRDESAYDMQAKNHKDWYVRRDESGQIQTIIKCTSREVTESGVEYRDGKLVRSDEDGFPTCRHVFVIPDLKVVVEIRYVRLALEDWKKIEDRARGALYEFMTDKPKP